MHIWANICYAATVKKGMQSKDIIIGIDVNIGKMVMIYIYMKTTNIAFCAIILWNRFMVHIPL